MIKEKMYVRCPADYENIADPRIFVCGQVLEIDEFKKTVIVYINDPFNHMLFFKDLPQGKFELPQSAVDHCSMFIGSVVSIKGKLCKILSSQIGNDGFYIYFVQDVEDRKVFKVTERDIIAPFNNGRIDPAKQLKEYEFQHPCWYLGRTVVSKCLNILDNSMYGFKELAGSKIYLLPHQLSTIMRCLQENPCRYMLADEVGMGKTIEAISIFKIFVQNKSGIDTLFIVPEMLKAQWEKELLLKFNISLGIGENNNCVRLKTIDEISQADSEKKWGFVIVDEIHRYMSDSSHYKLLHDISIKAKNILLLSATPVQQRKEEYLNLLRLLLPEKYDDYSIERFGELIEKQGKIIQKTALILDDLGDLEEEIASALKEEEDPHLSEDCTELFEDIKESLKKICIDLSDDKLLSLFGDIKAESEDVGVYAIKVVISYICSNYQIENNIIRNRRRILESLDEDERLLPTRELIEISYSLDEDNNLYESLSYKLLSDWIIKGTKDGSLDVEKDVRLLLSSFFSSPWSFRKQLDAISKSLKVDREIIDSTNKWLEIEQYNLEHIAEIMDDPGAYQESYSTRLVTVINSLYEDFYDKKIVMFTNYLETFDAYRFALEQAFDDKEISFFGEKMSTDEIEMNAFRFQNDKECRIMLCDHTGGEGRNFQCADYIVHIDLPWDASAIEQRIGRLDRLERDTARSVVYSVVVYAEGSFEGELFKFFKDGLRIFNQSLSGMEIIMNEINNQISSSIKEDFKYGLYDKIPEIIELAKSMRDIIRKEQNYDVAGFIFRPMYLELRRLINYYSQNENELFSKTMNNWASLAGFQGRNGKNETIEYSSSLFSYKSAINSQLIPPRWTEYFKKEQNKFVNDVQSAYNKMNSIETIERSIKGTFTRKCAIENDYLHFFAPGDEIFDCIVNNAMNSCKGQASAFAVNSVYNWKGIIFTWSLVPNIEHLLDNQVSIYALSPYRNYLISEQIIVPHSIVNSELMSEDLIIQEYKNIVKLGYKNSNIVHLGSRNRSRGILKSKMLGECSNVEWFKGKYSTELWQETVASARSEANKAAISQCKNKSNIRGVKEEMERTLSARYANKEYYDLDDDGIEELKRVQKVIMDAIKRPKLILDSAAVIWMVKE